MSVWRESRDYLKREVHQCSRKRRRKKQKQQKKNLLALFFTTRWPVLRRQMWFVSYFVSSLSTVCYFYLRIRDVLPLWHLNRFDCGCREPWGSPLLWWGTGTIQPIKGENALSENYEAIGATAKGTAEEHLYSWGPTPWCQRRELQRA